VLVAIGVIVQPPKASPQAPGLRLQAHAGGRGEATGESLRAFATSLELGVTALELDINISRDHQPLVWHDPIIEPQQCDDTWPVFAGDPSYPYVGKLVHDNEHTWVPDPPWLAGINPAVVGDPVIGAMVAGARVSSHPNARWSIALWWTGHTR
jgi:glycerophosphoryl diester phosphodiesterase